MNRGRPARTYGVGCGCSVFAEPDHDDLPNLDGVERLPDASHWVHHDQNERVNQLLIDFFAPALPTENR